MIDAETKDRLDEIEELVQLGREYSWDQIGVSVILAVVFTMFILAALAIVFWDSLCARIVVNAVRQGLGAVPPGK